MRRKHTLASLTVLTVAAALILSLFGLRHAYYKPEASRMTAAQIDGLRMRADAGQDQQALQALRAAARQGDTLAMRALAKVLIKQTQLSLSFEGVRFAEEAAKRGDAEAQYLLAQAYFDGSATLNRVPDMGRARTWFEVAADQQHEKAMYYLGLIHKSGYGIAPDQALAATWFWRAAQVGNADAMFMLGNAYLAGEGMAKDQSQALHWYRAAAELEHPLAAQTIAYAFTDGSLGLAQNRARAAHMMRDVEHELSHYADPLRPL